LRVAQAVWWERCRVHGGHGGGVGQGGAWMVRGHTSCGHRWRQRPSVDRYLYRAPQRVIRVWGRALPDPTSETHVWRGPGDTRSGNVGGWVVPGARCRLTGCCAGLLGSKIDDPGRGAGSRTRVAHLHGSWVVGWKGAKLGVQRVARSFQFFYRRRSDEVEVVGDAELRPTSVGAAWGFAAPEQTKGASEGSFECSMRPFARWQGWRAGACRAAWVKRVRVM